MNPNGIEASERQILMAGVVVWHSEAVQRTSERLQKFCSKIMFQYWIVYVLQRFLRTRGASEDLRETSEDFREASEICVLYCFSYTFVFTSACLDVVSNDGHCGRDVVRRACVSQHLINISSVRGDMFWKSVVLFYADSHSLCQLVSFIHGFSKLAKRNKF